MVKEGEKAFGATFHPGAQNGTDPLKDRARRLYQFIRELILLRQSPLRTVRSYEQVLPLENVPPKPDCSFIARDDFDDEEQDTWLEVRCPRFESFPDPPSILDEWIDPNQLANAMADMPTLLSGSRIQAAENDEEGGIDASKEEPEPTNGIEPPPQIKEAWERYIEDHWWPWAERTKPRFQAKKLYDELFRMYQKQEHLGETYEIVVGFGLLSWRPNDAIEIQRHLVTVPLSLELDSRRQIIILRPTATGVELRLEEDMIDQVQRPRTALRDSVKEQLKCIDSMLWSSEHLHDALKEYCNALASDAQYNRTYALPKVVTPNPTVNFAPAVILRKRGSEGMIGLVDSIIQNIENGGGLPTSVLQQICIMEDGEKDNAISGRSSTEENDEIYFPLPANRQQRRIVDELNHANGIVVEGPPGTGKSQTIANLVCHLLANGKRVLVTSHTARALQVLRDKIPEPIRPLCVHALSNDTKGMDALEYSVKGITDRQHNWDREDSKTLIDQLERELCEARERQQLAINEQRSIREAEVFRHEGICGQYSGTLAEIARQLKSEEEKLGFLTEHIQVMEPPGTAEQFRKTISVFNAGFKLGSENWGYEPPTPSDLVSPDEFENTLTELETVEIAISNAEGSQFFNIANRLKKVPPQIRNTLAVDLRTFYSALKKLRMQRGEVWLEGALKDVLDERDRIWSGRLDELKRRLNSLRTLLPMVFDARILGWEEYDPDTLHHHALVLRGHLEKRKGKGIRLGLFLPSKVKTALGILKKIRINGVPCEDLHEIDLLINWC
jgi:ribosomal protein S7